MLDGRVLEASQVEYKPFEKPPLQREIPGMQRFRAETTARAAIWLQVAFQARSSFAKGNPFSLFFEDPFFGTPCFLFFFFVFLSPKVGSLEMQPASAIQELGKSPVWLASSCRTRSNAGRTSARSLSVEYNPPIPAPVPKSSSSCTT